MAIAERLLRVCMRSFMILLTVTFVGSSFPTIASEEKPEDIKKLEPLQIEMTQRDLKIIEQLVAIAQRNSASVQETKAAMGLNAFGDVVSIELSSYQTTSNFTSPDVSSRERGLSFNVTIDPIKLIRTAQQLRVIKARWNEAKQKIRVAVVKSYVAYLQARQATIIAAYRIQKFTQNRSIASLHSQTTALQSINHLANPDYVAAATQMLSASAQERLALEELAACVSLSPQAMITFINGQ
ncbi:hypothetical protein F7734_30650 [Scytonema sp. UIC 10036]|uniref:hypothetical protein n=1 Tax=Scytonema sp. UIC 10036 TaxID=2304196 RepID=UPI0012DA71DA|nr:hypothetical protein [Scytonema sp. UIC 10036]MUG96469.1 hypothetical protein [Scytonema sp. UIC 10036]